MKRETTPGKILCTVCGANLTATIDREGWRHRCLQGQPLPERHGPIIIRRPLRRKRWHG
jgi:hypothetical protein